MLTIRNDSPDSLVCISYEFPGYNVTVLSNGTLNVPNDLVAGYTGNTSGGWTLV